MDDQLHIIIASERGKIRTVPFNKRKLGIIAAISGFAFVLLLSAGFFFVTGYGKHPGDFALIKSIRHKLTNGSKQYTGGELSPEDKIRQLEAQIASLTKEKEEQAAAFKEEKSRLLNSSTGELIEKAEILGKTLKAIGIKVPKSDTTDTRNSGGPFIPMPEEEKKGLLKRADKYLKIIKSIPFGRPVPGRITSSFGRRRDPLNKRVSMHEGVDLRGRQGDKIYATADGVVTRALRNGGYGNFITIDHGNGYKTSFAHMNKYLVKRGQKVTRGQVIGLVGSSGRSTGPHLHYEVLLDNRPINPYKFINIAKILEK